MTSLADANETVSDSGTETIRTEPKAKRKCTPAQLEVLKRNREKALAVIKAKGERTRLQQQLKEQYKGHVEVEREAEIARLKAALAESTAAGDCAARLKPAPKKKEVPTPVVKKRKRAPSPSESESSEDSPPPPPRRKPKKRKPPTPSDSSSSDGEDPNEARLRTLHSQMFPFG